MKKMKKSVVKKLAGLFVILFLATIASPVCGITTNEAPMQEARIDLVWKWAAGGGGSSLDYGYDVAADSNGNCYITGKFDGVATFGPLTLTSHGGWDVLVAKLDNKGVWQWAVNAGGFMQDGGTSIAVDYEGNSYITGVFYDVAWFGNITLTSIGGTYDPDVFVAKLDTNGNWLWAVRGGGYIGDVGYGIAVDSEGNSYVTGFFMYSAMFGSTQLTSQGFADVFVAKLDTNGVWDWAVSGGGSQPDYVCDIAVDTNGNIYLTGDFEGSATFGSNTITSLGDVDVFIAKLDSTGTWVWAKSGGSGSIERGYDIAVDSNANVYVTGMFLSSVTFGTITLPGQGGVDLYVVKLDCEGTWQWAVSAGSGATEGAWGITVDEKDNPFICGVFSEVVTIGGSTIVSQGINDVFVASLDSRGVWQWAMSAGGADSDEGYALCSDHSGSLFVTGYFDGSAFFGDTTVVTQGDFDVFISKLTYVAENQPPVADFSYIPEEPVVGESVLFDASRSYDPDGDIVSFEWDFGDETEGTGKTIEHAYSKSGTFTLSLTVMDREGAVNTLVKSIEISEAPVNLNFGIIGGIGVSVSITNIGKEDLRNVPWFIRVDGGLLGLITKTAEGTIESILAGESTSVKTGVFIGFGKITITARVDAEEETAEGKQFIIFSHVNSTPFLMRD